MPANVIYSSRTPLKDMLHYVVGDDVSISFTEEPTGTNEKLIAAVNCSRAYCLDEMEAVQRHFEKHPLNPSLDIVINFTGTEVTPQEALEIVTNVIRRMWEDRHQAVICIHENTDHLHAHTVLNTVSFIDGEILQDRFQLQHKLEEVTRQVFLEHDLPYIDYSGPEFYNRTHFQHSKGRYAVRDVVINDVNTCAENSRSINEFERNLKLMGYDLSRSEMTVSPERWIGEHKLNYKLSKLGLPENRLEGILMENADIHRGNLIEFNRRFLPLQEYLKQDPERDMSDPGLIGSYEMLMFLLKKEEEFMEDSTMPYPLEFMVRTEYGYFDKRNAELELLKKYGIDSKEEIEALISELKSLRAALEKRRGYLYQKVKYKTITEEERSLAQYELSEVKAKLKEAIYEIKAASSALETQEMIRIILEMEREAEEKAMQQERERRNRENDRHQEQRGLERSIWGPSPEL